MPDEPHRGGWASRHRTLALGGAATAIAVVVLAVVLIGGGEKDEPEVVSDALPAEPWAPEEGMTVAEPEQLYPEDGVLEVDLAPEPRTIDVSGSPILAQPWGDQLHGPTLHLEPGDTLKVDLSNGIEQPTNIHYHGLHVDPKGIGDNVFRTMKPGQGYDSEITIPNDHATGTFWYHVHFHGNTETQVMGGLTGMLIIDGLEDKLPEPLQDVAQHQLILKDIQTTSSGKAIETDFAKMAPDKPSTWLVNGYLRPELQPIAPGEVQLWRLSNQSADLFYRIALDDHRFTVLGEDGNPGWETYETDDLVLPPGKRFDVLVQGGEEGTYRLRTLHYDEGFDLLPEKTLARLPVTGAPQDDELPGEPLELTPKSTASLADSPIARRRTFDFTFATGPKGQFEAEINGQMFDPSKVDVVPVLNTVEEWTLTNHSDENHPFHIHVNDFEVISVDGRPYDAHGLQDVVVIPKHGGEVVIRNSFVDFTGEFVFHCHILGHEDAGMMQSVEVVGTPAEARQTQQIDQGDAHSMGHEQHQD